jgi:hypothetical protein
VLLWLVSLSFVADDVASLELTCSAPGDASSASAVPTCTRLNVTAAIEQSSARQHRMQAASAFV